MRLIDADKLINDLEHDINNDEKMLQDDTWKTEWENIQFDKDCKSNAINLLNNTPTVSADRPHGEWIEKNSHTYICDQCGFEQAIYGEPPSEHYNFCPNCGADMTPKGFTADEWYRDTFGENNGK